MKKDVMNQMKCDEIPYPVYLRNCNGKDMKLCVGTDGIITVSIPYGTDQRSAERFVVEKREWIDRQMDFQKRKKEALSDGSDGRHAVIAGKRYDVKTVISEKSFCEMTEDTLIFHVKENSAEQRKKLFSQLSRKILMEWAEEDRKVFDRFICENRGLPLPVIRIRKMKSRWGTCHPQKPEIILSELLIHVPGDCFRYVLLHEYAHLPVHNHSLEFYETVSSLMPQFRKAEKTLREYRF